MPIIVFEDPLVSHMYPVTVGRPAFAVSCGSYRLVDQLRQLGQPLSAVVRPHLTAILEADFADLNSGFPHDDGPNSNGPNLFVNARLVPSVAVRRRLADLLATGRSGVVKSEQSVAAALLPADGSALPDHLDTDSTSAYLAGLDLAPLDADLPLIEYPHDLIRHHLTTMSDNLEARLSGGGYREIADGVLASGEATLGAHAVVDSSSGPILLEEGASIGPYCFLQGPAHLGSGARVIEHAAIKDCVSLGHTTKIGGEIEASIIEPYTNKQHHGFLGHSYLGSWINLGAGTCNSDLKNTYGKIKMAYHGKKVATDMQFLGAILGDYVKTAINTGIFTGKTIGVCSMVYGFVTTNVPSFVNYARLFGQVTASPVEVLVAAQARMFERRNVPQRPCDIQLLHDMYELTSYERELGSVPPSPLSL